MADGVGECASYGIIGNIPHFYRSSHLRNYFSQFIESGGFECFHFKHRPDVRETASQERPLPASQLKEVGAGSMTSKAARTACCIVRAKKANMERLIKLYSRKHWLGDDDASLPALCIISLINVKSGSSHPYAYVKRSEQGSVRRDEQDFTTNDLKTLPELHPPPIMPLGNVGTPTRHFLELIRSCRLPQRVIKSLGLTFSRLRGNKKYSNVPFNYKISKHSHVGCSSSSFMESDVEVTSANGCKLHDEGLWDSTANPIQTCLKDSEDIESKYRDRPAESDEDDDGCEDWERHEALHDDPSNAERNEERLFEEKIELKWEKGGSGLVFYTDAQVWQKAEGDFDEQTADDWDVDMSVYYDENGGDMDARDSVAMRREKRFRSGADDCRCVNIGEFERHTKGIGRRILARSGWKDGGRLGKSMVGLVEALEGEGQHPKDKKGLGFVGDKVNRYRSTDSNRRQLKDDLPIISTIYDDHKASDPSDTLLRRHEPYNLKYRTVYGAKSFVRGSTKDDTT